MTVGLRSHMTVRLTMMTVTFMKSIYRQSSKTKIVHWWCLTCKLTAHLTWYDRWGSWCHMPYDRYGQVCHMTVDHCESDMTVTPSESIYRTASKTKTHHCWCLIHNISVTLCIRYTMPVYLLHTLYYANVSVTDAYGLLQVPDLFIDLSRDMY